MAASSPGHVVVIGASTGGVNALLEIAEALPAGFAAPVCIVLHIGSNPSLLPELLRFRGNNHAVHAKPGQRLSPGTLHVAPPDCHMLIEGDTLRLTHGPKENFARPAIDPLFRSAAQSLGPRAIGVILTGQMDDGTAGLKAIKECGGITVVQDPRTAMEQEMPHSALQNVEVEHCVALDRIAPLLARLVQSQSFAAASPVPVEVHREVAINKGAAFMEQLEGMADPAPLTCPDCGGGLWEMKDRKPLRYRCHTGHAYSALSLARAQRDAAEHALWAGVRALAERENLLRRVASIAEATGEHAQAAAGRAQAERLREQIRTLREVAQTPPAALDADAPA
jgi:two-component system chemotaxis response regulator CheB